MPRACFPRFQRSGAIALAWLPMLLLACGDGRASSSLDAAVVDAAQRPVELGGGTACDLIELAQQLAETENADTPIDCGAAVVGDPLSKWQSVSQCLKQRVAEKTAFYGGFQLPHHFEPDLLGYAYVGIVGPTFSLVELHYDSDPSGGTNPETLPRVVRHVCESFGTLENCEPAEGRVCMACFDQTRPDLIDLCPGW